MTIGDRKRGNNAAKVNARRQSVIGDRVIEAESLRLPKQKEECVRTQRRNVTHIPYGDEQGICTYVVSIWLGDNLLETPKASNFEKADLIGDMKFLVAIASDVYC